MKKLCTDCHYIGGDRHVIPGNFIIEIFLWLVFIVSGFSSLYSGYMVPVAIVSLIAAGGNTVYRIVGQKKICPECGHSAMIPIEAPKAQTLIREYHLSPQNTPEPKGQINPALVELLVVVLILLGIVVWVFV